MVFHGNILSWNFVDIKRNKNYAYNLHSAFHKHFMNKSESAGPSDPFFSPFAPIYDWLTAEQTQSADLTFLKRFRAKEKSEGAKLDVDYCQDPIGVKVDKVKVEDVEVDVDMEVDEDDTGLTVGYNHRDWSDLMRYFRSLPPSLSVYIRHWKTFCRTEGISAANLPTDSHVKVTFL